MAPRAPEPLAGLIDRRAISRALSRAAGASTRDVLDAPDTPEAGFSARIIGVTGSPGAGKSTLVGKLAKARLAHARRLAIIAIDPTSPRSEGSLLGDRIRMGGLSEDPRVFIRSLPSRSAEDGLTENLAEIAATLDAFGFDEIIIETVGAGQSAYGIRAVADVEILVLTPGAGDHVQAMKAGIMETADIYVVNKADQPGADRVAGELHEVLAHSRGDDPPPVIPVRHDEASGIHALDAAVQGVLARRPAVTSEEGVARSRLLRRFRLKSLVQRRLHEVLARMPAEGWDGTLRDTYERILDELR